MKGDVKPGYKMTEVGVIPEDWGTPRLCDISKDDSPICYGIVQVGCYVRGGVPVLAIKNLNSGYESDIHCTSRSIENSYSRSRVQPYDVLISVKGTTGRVGLVPNFFYGNISRDIARVRLADDFEPRFCFQMLKSDFAQRLFSVAAVGTTRMELSISILKEVRIPIPPTKAEQTAIATALSDVDALIESLEQLIAKKRNIKQGAMQELLTGKRRLPGFSGEWVGVAAGKIGRFRGGSCFPTAHQGCPVGKYPFFKVSDMNNEGNETFMKLANNYISEETRQRLGAHVFPENTIVFAKVGAAVFLERKKILARTSCIDNNLAGYAVSDDQRVDYRYIHYFLLMLKFGSVVSTTALPSLNSNVLNAIEILLPPSKAEQIAISSVLSEMDDEITVIETKLSKTRHLKQAMMQELLTGRIRLV